MRIVHLIDYFQPQLGYQEAHLARGQIQDGHDVNVICSDRYYPFPDYEQTIQPIIGSRIVGVGKREEDGIPVIRLPVRFESNRRCWLKGIAPTLSELKPDVVHSHNIIKPHTIQAARLKRTVGYRLLVDDHAHRVSMNTRWKGKLFYASFRQTIAPFLDAAADAVVAITHETAEIVRSIYGFRKNRVHVIELGVDPQVFQPADEVRPEIRSRLGFDEHDFVVVYTGKVVVEKGPELLLEALAHCPPQVKALIVGNVGASFQHRWNQVIAEHDLKGRVYVHPAVKQPELPPLYLAADAGCWPRQTSIAMLEAASCGLPILVVSEGVDARVSNHNGYMYEEGNVEQLAELINRLHSSPELCRSMGRNGRELVEREFSWPRICQKFQDLYDTQAVAAC